MEDSNRRYGRSFGVQVRSVAPGSLRLGPRKKVQKKHREKEKNIRNALIEEFGCREGPMKDQDVMSLASLLAGSLIGFAVSLLPIPNPYRIPVVLSVVVIIVFLLLVAIGTVQIGYREFKLRRRWRSQLRIGVLNDNGWDLNNPAIFAWTDISPEQWKSRLEAYAPANNLKLEVEWITVNSNFDGYVAILNPYGSVYPEEDLKNLRTLNRVTSFVREGGLFINVADIPFYYGYDRDLKRKLETTQPVYTPILQANQLSFAPTRLFELSPLAKELGIRILNVGSGAMTNLLPALGRSVAVFYQRAVINESNIESCIGTATVTFADGTQGQVTPLFFAKYGEGDFLISLFFINDTVHSPGQRESICDAISKLAIERLKELKGARVH